MNYVVIARDISLRTRFLTIEAQSEAEAAEQVRRTVAIADILYVRPAFVFHDGGRAAADFRGSANDCVTRAIAILTGQPYRDVYDDLNAFVRRDRKRLKVRPSTARTGISPALTKRYLAELGWTWHPTMTIGSGCTVNLRADSLPEPTCIAKLSGHVVAVIDGVVFDTHDPTRNGTRCVYGYWLPPGR